MEEVSLIQAWQLWWEATLDPKTHYLWGWQLFKLGRVGKIMSFLASLFVIAEIIGSERIKNFRNSVDDLINFETEKKSFKEHISYVIGPILTRFKWGKKISLRIFQKDTIRWNDMLDDNTEAETDLVSIFVLIIVSIILLVLVIVGYFKFYSYYIETLGEFSTRAFVANILKTLEWPILIIILLLLIYSLPILFSVIKTIKNFHYMAIDWLLLKPVYKGLIVVEHVPTLKVFSVILVIIGFHFDYLTS